MNTRIAVATAATLFAAAHVFAQGPGTIKKPAQPITQPAPDVKQPDIKAASKVLMVGDNAPTLAVEKWVKGDAVTGFEKGKIYIIEFWATWCGPCIAGMPHLSELQKEYRDKGLTVIGVTSKDSRNTLELVEAMVKDKADTMGYTVAWDIARKTNDAYLKAARQNFIPCSFLVDQNGQIAYIGHPAKIDGTLKRVIDGTFDMKSASEQYRKAAAEEVSSEDKARESRKLTEKYNQAMQAQDWAGAVAAYDEIAPQNPSFALNAAGGQFETLLIKLKNNTKAYAFGNQIVDGTANDRPMVLNHIAWTIVDPKNKVANKDLALALKAAELAAKASGNKDGAIIDTLARVHFCKGDIKRAIELQTKAVDVADESMKAELEVTLKEYTAALKN